MKTETKIKLIRELPLPQYWGSSYHFSEDEVVEAQYLYAELDIMPIRYLCDELEIEFDGRRAYSQLNLIYKILINNFKHHDILIPIIATDESTFQKIRVQLGLEV
jgi:hypothetical protein